MNPIVEKLKENIADNPSDIGDNEAHSFLEMLFAYYHECNGNDNEAVKAAFKELYRKMRGMSLKEMDKITDTVCSLCRDHKKTGFMEGVEVGIRLEQKLTK